MAKPKAQPGVVNKPIYQRASYLYQAATYLAQSAPNDQDGSESTASKGQHSTAPTNVQAQKATRNLSRQLTKDLRAVSLKSLVRHSPEMKRSICKFCESILIEGQTCHSIIENPSKGGKKAWADVLVTRCLSCNNVKRFPVSARKQKRKHLRQSESQTELGKPSNQPENSTGAT